MSWTEDLIGRWELDPERRTPGGPPAERCASPEPGAGSVQSHLQIGGQVEDACGQAGGPHQCRARKKLGNRCYALGQQMFGVGAWQECPTPIARVTAALMSTCLFTRSRHATCSSLTHENAQFHGGKNEKLLAFARGVSDVRGSGLNLGPENTRAIKEGHRKPAVPRKGRWRCPAGKTQEGERAGTGTLAGEPG